MHFTTDQADGKSSPAVLAFEDKAETDEVKKKKNKKKKGKEPCTDDAKPQAVAKVEVAPSKRCCERFLASRTNAYMF